MLDAWMDVYIYMLFSFLFFSIEFREKKSCLMLRTPRAHVKFYTFLGLLLKS